MKMKKMIGGLLAAGGVLRSICVGGCALGLALSSEAAVGDQYIPNGYFENGASGRSGTLESWVSPVKTLAWIGHDYAYFNSTGDGKLTNWTGPNRSGVVTFKRTDDDAFTSGWKDTSKMGQYGLFVQMDGYAESSEAWFDAGVYSRGGSTCFARAATLGAGKAGAKVTMTKTDGTVTYTLWDIDRDTVARSYFEDADTFLIWVPGNYKVKIAGKYGAYDNSMVFGAMLMTLKTMGNKVTLMNGSTTAGTTYAINGKAMQAVGTLSKTGYAFTGYYSSSSGGTQYYNSSGKSAKNWDKSADTTLYAQWSENTATLSYNANGRGTAPAAVTMKYTAACDAAAAITATGYTFKFWNTKADGSGDTYNAKAQVKAANVNPGAMTLYAIWSQNQTLTYNNNGHGTAPSAVTMTYPNETKAAAAITATGYTFNGWNTKADGKGTGYKAEAQVKAANKDPSAMTLYAMWSANKYKMTFDQQSGSGGTASIDATYDAGMPKATMPSRKGYTFGGYWTGKNGTGTQYYNANGSSTRNCNLTGATTLYAKWTAKTSTLSFNQNATDAVGGQTGTKVATYDAAMPDVTVPTRPGYAFRGYFDGTSDKAVKYYYADGHGTKNWDKDITTATTLYAQWKPAAEANTLPSGYTRVGAIQSSGSQYIDTGLRSTRTLVAEMDYTPIEYTGDCNLGQFSNDTADWRYFTYSDGPLFDCGNARTGSTSGNAIALNVRYFVSVGTSGNSTYLTITDVNTKAVVKSFTATCDGDPLANSVCVFGGIGTKGKTYSKMTLYTLKLYDIVGGTKTLMRNFIPCTNSSGKAGLYDPVTEEFYGDVNNGNFTIINPTVTVTLDPNGGAGGTASVSATFGQTMPEATMPTRTGYIFEGYFDAVEKKAYYNANGTSAALWDRTVATTLSAEWTAKDYDLTLDTQDGDGAHTTRVTFDVIPAMIAQPTKAKRKFAGYFTEPEGRGTMVFDEYGIATEPWTTDEAVTLYANWIMELSTTEPEATTVDMRAVKPAQVFKPEMLVTSPTGWEADAETAAIFEAIGGGQPVAVVDTVTAPVTVWTPQNVGLFTLTHTTGDGEETAQFNVTGFTYRVEFDANGGTGDAMAGVDLAYGAEGTAPACTYERQDYEFSGWNTRKDGSGTAIAVGEKYKNLVTDASETGYLYAQWTLKTAYEFHVDVKEGEPDPVIEKINLPTAWLEKNLPPDVDKNDSDKVKEELEKKDETGLKTWQKYVLGVDKDDKSAKVWIDSPQQKAKDKIKVTMKEYSPTKGTGFTVKYRLDTELKGKEKAKGSLENSPDFDIDLSGDKDPTGLYTVNVVFVPDGKTDSDEVVESVNTMGILRVPSQKTLEIVAVPWNRLAPDANQAVLVADLVKTATLTPGDKLHVYDRTKKTYKSWKYDIEKGWVALGTFKVSAAGLEQTVAPDQSEQTVARGSAVWLERQDASKPFYLYGQYSKYAVETKVTAHQHNLVASPKMEPFDLNGGGITGDIGANDQIIVPQGGDKPPKTYTYRSGTGWGYSKFVNGRFTFDTTDDEVPVGTGFWYISKGGSPTIRW